jgi:hypothetical protein
MPRKRKKKSKGGFRQQLALVLTGSALTLCALSVMYGFLIRKSMAENNLHDLRIEILNGTGEQGLARAAAMSLIKKGVDVIDYGNAADFSFEESMLIARRKNDGIRALGRNLGCDNIVQQYKEDSLADAVLILGADYGKLHLER